MFGRSVIERVGRMKRLVLWCIREVGSSRSMIWKRVGRVSDLVESPYSCSTKAPGFGPMPMPPSSISIWCHRGPRKVWRNPVRGDGYARINQEQSRIDRDDSVSDTRLLSSKGGVTWKHCHRQNVTPHHFFDYINFFGFYHNFYLLSK